MNKVPEPEKWTRAEWDFFLAKSWLALVGTGFLSCMVFTVFEAYGYTPKEPKEIMMALSSIGWLGWSLTVVAVVFGTVFSIGYVIDQYAHRS